MRPENEGMVSHGVGPPGLAICRCHTQAGIRLACLLLWCTLVKLKGKLPWLSVLAWVTSQHVDVFMLSMTGCVHCLAARGCAFVSKGPAGYLSACMLPGLLWCGTCMPSAQLLVQDDKGVKGVTFPQPAKGFRDFLFYDRSIQVSVGNRGSLTILVPKQS